jgi:hypothetical protein
MKMDFLDGVEVPNHPTEDSGFDEAFFNAHGLTDDYCALLQTLSSRPKTQVEPSIRFFNYAPSEQKVIDWLIAFGNAPTGWTPKAAYPHISCDPEILASALNLTDVELWYSSVDFEGECWLTESPDTVKEIHALARKAAPDWPTDLGLMRAGVNFTANAHFFSSLDEQLRKQLGLDASLKVNGAVGVDDDGVFIELEGRIANVSYTILGAAENPESAQKEEGNQVDRLTAFLTSIRVRASGLDEPDTLPVFRISLIGHLLVGKNKVNLTLDVSGNGKMLELLVEPEKTEECKDWLENLIPGFGEHLSPLGESIHKWTPSLQSLRARIPIGNSKGFSATLVLGYDENLKLFNDLVELRPTLTLQTDFTLKGTSVELTGHWIVNPGDDEAQFDVSLSWPQGDAYVALTPGCHLHLPKELSEMLEPVRKGQKELEVVHMELEGNFHERSFSMEILTLGRLAFPVNKGVLEVGDVEFALEKDDGGWYATLGAVLAIGQYELTLLAQIGETMKFTVEVPSVSLASLAQDLFNIDPPEDLADACIERCLMDLSIGEKISFNFSATSNAVVHVGGAEVRLQSLDVAYDRSHKNPFELKGTAQIKAGETMVDLELAFEQGTWRLTGAVKTKVDLAALVNGMAGEIGFESPFAHTPAEVDSFAIDMRFGKAGTRIAIRCDFRMANKKYHLFLIAGKAAITDEESSPTWQHFVQIGAPSIDLFDLPLVGDPLRSFARAVSTTADKDVVAGLENLTFRLTSTYDEAELKALFDGLDSTAFPEPKTLGGKASVHTDITLLDYKKALDYPPVKEKEKEKEKEKPAESSSPAPPDAAKGDTPVPPAAPLAPAATKAPAVPAAKPAFAPPTGNDRGWWMQLDRSLGPVTLERVGVATDLASVSFMIDASARFGPVKLGLLGLEAKARIALPIKPELSLKGVVVGCTTDALRLSGGMVKRGENNYAGSVMIGYGKVALSAIGSYIEIPPEKTTPPALKAESATPHIAIFAVLDTPLGGPPMFYINGLAGGIGYNRAWTNVPLADIAKHPMIIAIEQGAVDNRAIDRFDEISRPSKGDHWVAAGIKFTSFKIIDGTGLLVLSLGAETRVNLLAKLDLTFPPKVLKAKVPALVHAEILMQAEYRPSAGEIKVDGMLAPGSFLLSEQAAISGGFALYCWLDPNPHAGDFVLTLGGYHPRFKVPAHYPRVERLALNWRLSDQVQIKGEQYFALTPSAVMAGGLLEVNYRAGWGSASFKAQADFIIFFQPFAYSAKVSIAVHVDAQIEVWPITLKLALDLAVSMEIWGPPFGAVARISFYGLSKDIALGAPARSSVPEVTWIEFRNTFLPLANHNERVEKSSQIAQQPTITDSLITLAASSGLLARLDPKTKQPLLPQASPADIANAYWLVDPGALQIELALSIPARTLSVDKASQLDGEAFGIGPMNLAQQALDVAVTVDTGQGGKWLVHKTLTAVPMGLWNPLGRPTAGAFPEKQTIPGVLTGAQLTLEVNRPKVFCAEQSEPKTGEGRQAWWVRSPRRRVVADPDMNTLRNSIATPEVCARRLDLLQAIATVDKEIAIKPAGSSEDAIVAPQVPQLKLPRRLEQLAVAGSGLLVDAPRICRWGTE